MRPRPYAAHYLLVLLVTIVSFQIASLHAHQGATGIVKTRMESMKSMAKQMKDIKALLSGKVAFDESKLEGAAQTIADHAQKIPDLFPQNSLEHPSEAVPLIWEKWERFEKSAEELAIQARLLEDLADPTRERSKNGENQRPIKVTRPQSRDPNNRTAFEQAFKALVKTCKNCHQSFRKKKDESIIRPERSEDR